MAPKSTSARCKFKCLFCDYESRIDNFYRHCQLKHTLENTAVCGGIVINNVRIIGTETEATGYCFGCDSLIRTPKSFNGIQFIQTAVSNYTC